MRKTNCDNAVRFITAEVQMKNQKLDSENHFTKLQTSSTNCPVRGLNYSASSIEVVEQ